MTYKIKDRLRIWILESNLGDEPLKQNSDPTLFIVEAITELKAQKEYWTHLVTCRPKLPDGPNAARDHADKLRTISYEMNDLGAWLLELDNESGDNRFESYRGEILDCTSSLEAYLNRIEELAVLIERIERFLTPALSLYIPLDSNSGIDSLKRKLSQYRGKLSNAEVGGQFIDFDEVKTHPALEWAENRLNWAEQFRKKIEELVAFVDLVYILDIRFGSNINKETIQKSFEEKKIRIAWDAFDSYRKGNPNTNWLRWSLVNVSALEELDPDNRTNWKDLIRFGRLTGLSKVKKYLSEEVEKCSKLEAALENSKKQRKPLMDPKIMEHIEEGSHPEALIDYIEWLGTLEEEAIETVSELDEDEKIGFFDTKSLEISKELEDLHEWKYIENRVANDSYPNPSMYAWFKARITEYRKPPEPDESSSHWYRSKHQEFKTHLRELEKTVTEARDCLKNLQKRKSEWISTWNDVEHSESEYMNAVTKFYLKFWQRQENITKKKQTLLDNLKLALNIAPGHEGLLQKMKVYDQEIPETSSSWILSNTLIDETNKEGE